MIYLLINLTNYGDGYSVVGTFRSERRAKDLATKLSKEDDDQTGNSWSVLQIESMDKYTDDSIIKYAEDK